MRGARRPGWAAPAALVCAVGCGQALPTGPDAPGSLAIGPGTTSSSGPLVFTASPVDPAVLDFILPLVNLNPPDHTLPADHIFLS